LTDCRILTTWYAFGQDKGYPETNWNKYNLADESTVNGRRFVNEHIDSRGDNHILARKIAAESTVYVPDR
jgi:beta-glucosidase